MSNVSETTTISVDKKDVELIETTTPLKNNNELKELKDTKKTRNSTNISTMNIVKDIKKKQN